MSQVTQKNKIKDNLNANALNLINHTQHFIPILKINTPIALTNIRINQKNQSKERPKKAGQKNTKIVRYKLKNKDNS